MTTRKTDGLIAAFLALALLVAAAATVDVALMRAAFVVFLTFVAVLGYVGLRFLALSAYRWWNDRQRMKRRLAEERAR